MTQNERSEIVTAIGFAVAFLESELPPGRGYPDAWQLEVKRSVKALRELHRQLSPEAGRLAAVGAEPARRSNFGNVGPSEW